MTRTGIVAINKPACKYQQEAKGSKPVYYWQFHISMSPTPPLCLMVAVALLLVGATLADADIQFSMTWAKKWQDSHFASGAGSVDGYGLAIDAGGYVYISGATCDGNSAPYYGFIAKFDSELNEIWYERDYIPPVGNYTGVHRVAVAADGNLIAHATAVEEAETYARVMKVSSADGSIMWQTDIARGTDWASIWDGAVGPALDSAGNIYIATGLREYGYPRDSEPIGIYKLDADGEILWEAKDYLHDYYTDAEGWDDIWELVVDSEGSVYISGSADMTMPAGDLNFGLVKYDTEGQRVWTRCKDWGGSFDAPRGLAIDDEDYLYQSGNVDGGPGVWKLDKEGNVLAEEYLPQDAKYPYGSLIDAEGNLVLHGIYPPDCISEFNLYSPDLTLLASFEYQFPGCASYDTPTRGTLDPWGNLYLLQYFDDDEYNANSSIGVIKIGDKAIPEPATLALFALGLVGTEALRRWLGTSK